ncbi:hypothetical protein QYE76_006017 [Lolium multiflorum]|uniref:EF-1-gamma C-terminal domain-containing protein n=1 Tax=Lolium multiflorum TaxID=4521 RepID=A0AAD8RVM4_LOLMU|nr:hypothetical protein QYE76_006017 [Lolium multiflorum]
MWVINSFSECEIAVGSEMRVASEFRINLDIHNSALLSEYCLIEFGGAVPPKMERLFKKMKCYTTNKGYSLITDPSLIAAHLWSSAFLDTFHMIFHEMPETERSSFLRKLDACCQGWHKEMIANKLLKYFVTYSHPDGTLANRDKNSSKAFLECIRHILSHPLDYLKMMERLGLGSYTKEDLHLLLQEKGGDKLMSDIWDILAEDHKERLKKLSLERYLCRMGSSCCPLPTICVRRSFKDEPSRFDPYTSTYLKRIYDQRINQEKLFLEPPVLRKWKIEYAKNRLSAIEGFWSMFASLGEYSIWICVREDDVECQKHATKNTVCALMQKMSACRAYSFGKMVVLGTSSGPFKMKGFWVFPKASVPSFLMEIHGMSCYGWTRVNTSLEKEKDFVDSVLNENIPNEGPVVAASYL